MANTLTLAESMLINAYRATSLASERAAIIRRYADFTHLSLGRAEDALDLWVHMLKNSLRGRAMLTLAR